MSAEPPSRSGLGRLDAETRRTGLEGVAHARAALREARQRAEARDAARLARRDDELAQRAKSLAERTAAPSSSGQAAA